MPGNVPNASPTAVMPLSLSRAFVHERSYPVLENEYRNGESQRSAQAATSRKRWRLAKRLTAVELQALRDFYDARNGPQEPFYFYDPWDTIPQFSYDPTGQAIPGRYSVRFEGSWSDTVGLGRIDTQIELVEVA